MITGGMEEIIALIEAGRAAEALPLTYTFEQVATAGNRYVPLPRLAALYLRGRAHQELGQWEPAAESYAALLDLIGDGAQEAWLFRDTPDRLAAVRRSRGLRFLIADRRLNVSLPSRVIPVDE